MQVERIERFVRSHTRLAQVALVPELRLWLGDDPTPLWHATQAFMLREGLVPAQTPDPPYWAYAWAGGQALARWILDDPARVRGKAILDVASGNGVVGLAAKLAGAAKVLCADLDPMAEHVARMNARENHLAIEAITADAASLQTTHFDVICGGDVFYDASMSSSLLSWLVFEASAGRDVYAADPGRSYAPRRHATEIAAADVQVPVVLEGQPVRHAKVFRIG